MNQDRIIEKIKKLFALAHNDGATGAEAENAMRMAQKLLEKHAVSMFDLADKDEVGMSMIAAPASPWVRTVVNGVSKLYNCKYIISPAGKDTLHLLVGTDGNRTTAKIVIKQLIDQITKETKLEDLAFRLGAAETLHAKCMQILSERKSSTEEVVPGTGLVPLDIMKRQQIAIDDYVSKEFGKLGQSRRSNQRSSAAGREYGKSLNPGARVGGGQKRLAG